MKRVNPTLWGANYGHVHLKANPVILEDAGLLAAFAH